MNPEQREQLMIVSFFMGLQQQINVGHSLP